MSVNDATINLSPLVYDLGVVLDSTLSSEQRNSSICYATHPELRRISSIRQYKTHANIGLSPLFKSTKQQLNSD